MTNEFKTNREKTQEAQEGLAPGALLGITTTSLRTSFLLGLLCVKSVPKSVFIRVYSWLLLLCLLVAIPSMAHADTARHVQYSFTIQNGKDRVLDRAEFWTYAPVKATASQTCRQLKVSYPYDLVTDSLGNQIIHIVFSNLPPFAVKIVTVEADVDLLEKPEASEVSSVLWLGPEPFIETTDPEFKRLAPTFKAADEDALAADIFKWVSGNLRAAGYTPHDRGALYALKNKTGDCSEFTYLFVALCRANDIQARGVSGYICDRNQILKPDAYHDWAEFYDGKTWKLADPFNNIFGVKSSQYVAMRILGLKEGNPMGDYPRFRYQGEGLEARMND